MSTKNFVPRANNEGGIGTEAKQWGSVWSKNIYVDGTNVKNTLTTLEQSIGTLNIAAATKATTFNSVALMKEAPLEPGTVAMTTGYHNPNDGGAGVYNIRVAVSGETYDDGSLILLDNGNVAEFIYGSASYRGQQEIVEAINGVSLNLLQGTAPVFSNVAAMKAAPLLAGATVRTKGYYAVNDGGSALYNVRAKTQDDVEDGGSIIFLDNGNVAELIVDEAVNVKQFGAKGDEIADDSDCFIHAITYAESNNKEVIIPNGKYVIRKTLDLTSLHVIGDGNAILHYDTNLTQGFVARECFVENLAFLMSNNFSGKLFNPIVDGSINYASQLKIQNISLWSNNTNRVGTLMQVDVVDSSWGAIFKNIKFPRRYNGNYSYTLNADKGFYFKTASGKWATQCIFEDIMVEGYFNYPFTVDNSDGYIVSSCYFNRIAIQCMNHDGFIQQYLAKFDKISFSFISNSHVFDYNADYLVGKGVIYHNCSNVTIYGSDNFDVYSDKNYNMEGTFYGASAKKYNSHMVYGLYVGRETALDLNGTKDKVYPVLIPLSFNSKELFTFEFFTVLAYGSAATPDAYFSIKTTNNEYAKNMVYRYYNTGASKLIKRINKYKQGLVVWIKASATINYNTVSMGVPIVATGMTVQDYSGNDVVLAEESYSDSEYVEIPLSKSSTIINGTVIDHNTVI